MRGVQGAHVIAGIFRKTMFHEPQFCWLIWKWINSKYVHLAIFSEHREKTWGVKTWTLSDLARDPIATKGRRRKHFFPQYWLLQSRPPNKHLNNVNVKGGAAEKRGGTHKPFWLSFFPWTLMPLHNYMGWLERMKPSSKCMSSFLCSTEKIYSVWLLSSESSKTP